MSFIDPFPHTFTDGPGNTASGEEVMDNLNLLRGTLNDWNGGRVTSLPGSPSDGDRCRVLAQSDKLWELEWVTSQSAWVPVGQPSPMFLEEATQVSTASTTYTNVGVGTKFHTVPFTGTWQVRLEADVLAAVISGVTYETFYSFEVNALGAADSNAAHLLSSAAGGQYVSVSKTSAVFAATAGDIVWERMRVSGSAGFAKNRRMLLWPIKLT